MPSILFVEDDQLIASGLIYALEQEGYDVSHCKSLSEARSLMDSRSFSLGLLDLSLPDGTSYDLCRRLKELHTPVVFLTAVDDEGNVVKGLELGADDYITKPFRLRELLARIKNVLRRAGVAEAREGVISVGQGLHIHPLQAKVYRGSQEIELSALEYRLLLSLATHRGQVLTRSQLLEGIWDIDGNFVSDNTLTVTIKRLREKLGDHGSDPQLIQTIRGMGYLLNG